MALLVVAAAILLVALLRSVEPEPKAASDPKSAEELSPEETSGSLPASSYEDEEETGEESSPNIDPATGMVLEEDELPIATP